MSKESNRRKFFYNIGKWLWTKGAYWGDKLLTLLYLVLFGLFILAYKIINKGLRKSWTLSLFVLGGIKSAWRDWRMGRRIKNDFKNYGLYQIPSDSDYYNTYTNKQPEEKE